LITLRFNKECQGEFSSPFSYNIITNIVLKLREFQSPKFPKLECPPSATNPWVYSKRYNMIAVDKIKNCTKQKERKKMTPA